MWNHDLKVKVNQKSNQNTGINSKRLPVWPVGPKGTSHNALPATGPCTPYIRKALDNNMVADMANMP